MYLEFDIISFEVNYMNIIFFILALTAIISIHELGHLVTAKMFGVYCFEYSIGMGPKIYSKKFKETVFSIRAIPFGGYVAMAGETDNLEEYKKLYGDVEIPFSRTLPGISKIKRIIVMLAGIFMNFVLAYIIIVGLLFSNGVYNKSPEPVIKEVVAQMPAAEAGLKENDKITYLEFSDGTIIKNPKNVNDVINYISYKGGNVKITVLRNQKELTFDVNTVLKDDRNMIGIVFVGPETIRINLLNVWAYGFQTMIFMISSMLVGIYNLLRGIGLSDVSGPVGIYKLSAKALSYGFKTYLNLVALLSLNIGILNDLPIPALDGGRVMLVIVEAIIGKPVNKKLEKTLIVGSMMILLALILLVTISDVIKLF